jgi:hypothetical protein
LGAKENSPSLISIDEGDSLLLRATALVGEHDIRATEQPIAVTSEGP